VGELEIDRGFSLIHDLHVLHIVPVSGLHCAHDDFADRRTGSGNIPDIQLVAAMVVGGPPSPRSPKASARPAHTTVAPLTGWPELPSTTTPTTVPSFGGATTTVGNGVGAV
jgi:hypothetical protein